jgi:hypothetical protein
LIKEARLAVLFSPDFEPTKNELDNGVKEAADRLSLIWYLVASRLGRIMKDILDRTQLELSRRLDESGRTRANVTLENNLKDLREISTLEEWQDRCDDKLRKEDERREWLEEEEEEEDYEETVRGSNGAPQFRNLVQQCNPLLGRPDVVSLPSLGF